MAFVGQLVEMPSYPAFADAQESGGLVEGKETRNAGTCLGEENIAIFVFCRARIVTRA